jgi:hypothetical protein
MSFAGALAALVLIQALPAGAANVAPLTIRRPAANTPAGSLAARAAAHASNAAGNPYVNPKVGNGPQSSLNSAAANANAAEIRSANVPTGP